MNDKSLDWKDFDWKEFQTLCIRVGEAYFPGVNFDPYLKEGQKLDGLDIITFKSKEGSFLGIQCKDVKRMTLGDIDKAIKALLDGALKNKVNHFVLTTSADLQSRTIQNQR